MDGPTSGVGPRSAQGVSSKSTGEARARASSSEPGAIWPARASRRRVWSPKNSRRAESSGCPLSSARVMSTAVQGVTGTAGGGGRPSGGRARTGQREALSYLQWWAVRLAVEVRLAQGGGKQCLIENKRRGSWCRSTRRFASNRCGTWDAGCRMRRYRQWRCRCSISRRIALGTLPAFPRIHSGAPHQQNPSSPSSEAIR